MVNRRSIASRAAKLRPRPLVATDDQAVLLVPLNDGSFAAIDANDRDAVAGRCWQVMKNGRGVVSGVGRSESRGPGLGYLTIRLHRALMRPPVGLVVDHIDGDVRNNRRSNLRVCTPQQNLFNKHRTRCAPASGFKGVRKARARFEARISANGVIHKLGFFATAEEAARAYDAAATRIHGAFAALNFPGLMATPAVKP